MPAKKIRNEEQKIMDAKSLANELRIVLEKRISPGTPFRDVVIKEIIGDITSQFVIIEKKKD